MVGAPATSASTAMRSGDGSVGGSRCRDPETLGQVVDHEPDHEKRAELELSDGEARADREPFAEVVHADPDRDEQAQASGRWLLRHERGGQTGTSCRAR